MKFFILLTFVFIVFVSSCVSNKASSPAPVPEGSFSGIFRAVHTSRLTAKRDTISANLLLAISLAKGFQVTGDTSTVHAGSYGDFSTNVSSGAGYIQFVDLTYSSAHPGTKRHLNGVYKYQYDGTTFQLLYNSADTLSLQYNFKKIN